MIITLFRKILTLTIFNNKRTNIVNLGSEPNTLDALSQCNSDIYPNMFFLLNI